MAAASGERAVGDLSRFSTSTPLNAVPLGRCDRCGDGQVHHDRSANVARSTRSWGHLDRRRAGHWRCVVSGVRGATSRAAGACQGSAVRSSSVGSAVATACQSGCAMGLRVRWPRQRGRRRGDLDADCCDLSRSLPIGVIAALSTEEPKKWMVLCACSCSRRRLANCRRRAAEGGA